MPQVPKPFILDLPERFKVKLDWHLREKPPKWKFNTDNFYYIIHYLTLRHIQLKNKDKYKLKEKYKEYYPIDFEKLNILISGNARKYVGYLVDAGFLSRDYYIKGEKPYHYKLSTHYIQGHCQVLINPRTKLFEKIDKDIRSKRSHANRDPEFLQHMRRTFMKLEFDYTAAREWVDSQPDEKKKFVHHTALTMIQDKRLRYFKRNKTNYRLDTNLTNLKSDLRHFMIGDFTEIDLKNSQPLLFGQLLSELCRLVKYPDCKINDIPLWSKLPDLDILQWFGRQTLNRLGKIRQNGVFEENGELFRYLKSVRAGSFYDDFSEQYNGGISREEAKDITFKVFFSRNILYEKYKRIIPYEKEKKQFANLYPGIYEIIKTLKGFEKDPKGKRHAKLSVFLQRIEARTFIDTICPRLVDAGIIPLTVHDSIIVPCDQAAQASGICKDAFEELFGVVPTFHRNSI